MIKAICSLDHNHFPLLKGWAHHVINHTGAIASPIIRKTITATSTLDGILAQSGKIIACDTDIWWLRDAREFLASFDWGKIGMVRDAGRWNPTNWVTKQANKTHGEMPYLNLGMIICDMSLPATRAVFERAHARLLDVQARGTDARGGDAWRWGQTLTSLEVNASGLWHDLGWGFNYFCSHGCPWEHPAPEEIYAVHCPGGGPNAAKKLEKLLTKEARHGTPFVRKREDFGELFTRLGYEKGVEIGVSKGVFAEQILSKWKGSLLGVDSYQDYAEFNDVHFPTGKDYDRLEAIARQRMAKYGQRWSLQKAFSQDAAAQQPDAGLDFVYIDANHSYEAVAADISSWFPKVRPGGFIGGHDYSVDLNPPPYPGVIQAVDEFAASLGVTVQRTREAVASWWIIKPI